MRILHLLSQTELTGAEVYAKTLSDLQKKDHPVYVISDKIHADFSVPWTSLPISVNKFSTRWNNILSVRQFLKKQQIDIIHCHSRAAVRIAARARRGLPVAMISTIHGRQHSSFGKKWSDLYGEYKILVCDNLRYQFENEFGISADSLKIIRNPIDTELFSQKKMDLQQSSHLKNRIAFVGRSSGPKGERLKIFFKQALFHFLKAHPQIKIDIIASEPENFGSAFLQELHSWRNPGQIRLLPKIKNIHDHYPRYDLILGAGRVAVEAILAGVSVLSFGENTSHGLVTEQNLRECLATNFGDIGPGEFEGDPRLDILITDLQDFYRNTSSLPSVANVRQILLQEFDRHHITSEIEETYKAALFKKNVSAWIPHLMYHRVPTTPPRTQHRIFVTKSNFIRHLRLFRYLGFETLHFSEILDFWNLKRPYSQFPNKPLILTFDDGYEDNLSNALPQLEKAKAKANLFLLSDTSIQENIWDKKENQEPAPRLLSPTQRQEIAKSPLIEIGSHGLSHRDLTTLSSDQILQELSDSKKHLEAEFKRPIHSIAFPFGKTNSEIAKLAKASGYDFGINTDQGGINFSDNRWSLFRVNIFPEENIFTLWKKTSPWYRKRFYKKHLR